MVDVVIVDDRPDTRLSRLEGRAFTAQKAFVELYFRVFQETLFQETFIDLSRTVTATPPRVNQAALQSYKAMNPSDLVLKARRQSRFVYTQSKFQYPT